MLGFRGKSPAHSQKTNDKRTPEPPMARNGTPPNGKPAAETLTVPATPPPPAAAVQNREAAAMSPASMTGSVRLNSGGNNNKRIASYTRRSNLVRAATGQSSNVHLVKDQYTSVRNRAQRELGASVGLFAFDTSYAGLSDWIKHERMARLPHKGGSWDQVLIAAHYFAAQVSRLSDAIESFTPDCEAAANLLYGQCLVLLELGHENAGALQTAFDLFYQLGLELSPLLRAEHALLLSPSIMEDVSRAFSELLHIVSGIAIGFHSAVHGSRQMTTRLDIFATFGASIEAYRSRVGHCELEIWNFELRAQGYDDTTKIELLKEWLAPQDKVLAFLSSNHISLATRPESYTCIWFQPHLNQFFKHEERVLLVEGKSGSGKTTLANWVVNRLQRPIGGRVIPTLSFFYNSSIPAQSSCISMLKTLLFQLLSLRISDVELFGVVLQAYTDSKSIFSVADQEERLWAALRQALANIGSDDEELAIVIDGLDEMDGLKPAAKQVSAKLQSIAHDTVGLKVLLFSQPLEVQPTTAVETVELSLENIYDDLQIVIQQGLASYVHYADRSPAEQDSIVDGLIGISDGSMLLAALYVRYLVLQKTHEGFGQAVEALVKAPPRNVAELVQRYLGLAKIEGDSRTVISLLTSTKRPLSLKEVEILLRSDSKGHNNSKPVIWSEVIKSIAALTVTVEGLIILRHDAIKQALINIPDTSNVSLHLKDRHRDLLIRLFTSSGKHVRDVDEPRLDLLTSSELEKRIASHHLVEYTVRYWAVHFKLSSLFKVQGDLPLPEEFGSVFPSSVSFALLEATTWRTQYVPSEAVELLTIAYRVRKQLFGPDNVSVLQSAILCAIFYETVLTRFDEATEWYALVVRIGKTVLGLQSDIVLTCCHTLLRISETLVTTKRTSIMTFREEILLVLIASYTHTYGATSTEVIQYYEQLEQLYVHISEETKATEIRVKIREVRGGLERHTHHGGERDQTSRHLDVILKKGTQEEQVEGFESLLFGFEEEVEETWTIAHVDKLIVFALELVKRGQFTSAEQIYVDLWLKLSDHCAGTIATEWHEKRIEVMLKYASFLQTQKRIEESSAVLISCWTEYSTHHVSNFESVILLLRQVAVSLKAVGMISLSLTVFQRCWSWFKSSRKEESTVFKEIVESIAVTSSELVKKSTETTVTKTTTSSETVIREVFESSFSSLSEETQVSTTTIELCSSLTSIYFEQERWSEAVSVIKSTLKRSSWSSFFSESIESISIKSAYASECIKLVLDLAQCYISQKRYDRVEQIYARLYRVHLKSLKFDDAAVVLYRQKYIDFLIKYEMHSVLITFYQELLVEYRSFYGAAHAKTIAILYALGDVCRTHHLTHGYWIEYYSEIIVSLNKGGKICHEDALRALIIVAEYYYDLQRYSEALVYLKCLVATFAQFGTKYEVFKDTVFIQKTFERYYRVIEETQVEISERIAIMKEIREACTKYFGESSAISLSVTVTLAEVCTKSEKYEYEALSYYEHILKHSSTISASTVKRSQSTLRTLYVKQITSKTTSTTVTTEVIEKATKMTYERYAEVRKTHSCTHQTTLSTLKELVVLYQKQKRTELVIKELQGLIVECVLSTSSTKELIETARFLATIFAESYVSEGVQLVRELKLQVIYKTVSKTAKFNVSQAGRASFAFIASFEYHLRARVGGTVATFMAEILAEYLFYERLTASIKKTAKIGVVILLGARLRHLHYRTHRAEDFEFVERQVLTYFTTTEKSVVVKSSQSAVRGFVRILLAYFSERGQPKDFVASAARAAVTELRAYLSKGKYPEALGLAQCTYRFLMAHEGLDDPTEITLGFQLCLMMAGRGEYKRGQVDAETNKAMLALSNDIIGEVFDICKNNKIDLFRCPLHELNELIALLGEQNNTPRLLWLLEILWTKRGGQAWGSDVKLTLGKRLVQARFVAGDIQVATRLAEDIVYNLRRTNGPRNKATLAMYELVASIYTSAGAHFQTKSTADKANPAEKKRDAALAKSYFKKAVTVNEDILKALVEIDADDSDDDDDDTYSILSGSHYGSGANSLRNRTANGARKISSKFHVPSLRHATSSASKLQQETSDLSNLEASVTEQREQEAPREVLVAVARKHLRLAKLAVQRLGGWDNKSTQRRFESITAKIWREFSSAELKLKEDQVLSTKWKVVGFGEGKAEGGLEEDGFAVPSNWAIY